MPAVAPARDAAYRALRAVMAGRSDLPGAMAEARSRLADERDRSLAAEVVSGTLRQLAALDAVIAACAGRPVERLDAEVLDILRLSAYQLVHLERVPARATVHDGVELARLHGKGSAAGFVNAVLRRIGRERDRLPLPSRPAAGSDRDTAALDYLSVTLSHPRWLVARWLSRFGFEACEAWAQFDNAPPPLTLRANTLRTTVTDLARDLLAHGVECEPTRFAPDGLTVRRGNPLRSPLADTGLFLVQDEASQLVAVAAGGRPGERLLDACAAPGGKTVAIAGDLGGIGLVVAADLRERRIRLLRQTLRSAGADSVRVVRADASKAWPFGPSFDCVLVDAPCSGLGTIRRDPEIRWRRTEEELARFAAVQDDILHRAADAVRPGGRLVYATCSSEPEENEDRVAVFLDAHGDFELADATAVAPRGAALRPVVSASGFLQTRPFDHGLEAFFAAVMTRRASGIRAARPE